MSFKTFNCVLEEVLDPNDPFPISGSMIQVVDEFNIGALYVCNNDLSNFLGAEPLPTGVTKQDFDDLWPMLLLMIVTAVGFRMLFKMFRRR